MTFLAAFLTQSVSAGALIGGVFGALRALIVLLAAGVRTDAQYGGLAAKLERWNQPSAYAARGALQGAILVAAVGLALA